MITGSRQPYIGHDRLITSVFLQLIDAVAHCHALGIFHRDLKPENVLCARGGGQLLLADFGLATSERSSKDFGCGSTFYMSPECQGGLYEKVAAYDTAANDTWSLGVILVNLTCGRNPWRQASVADETFRAFVADGNFLRTILPISRACNEILQAIFQLDPADRVSLRELRQKVKAVRRWNMVRLALSAASRCRRRVLIRDSSLRAPQQSEDELVSAHEQARVAAEASGHTTSRRLQARAAVLEQRRREELAGLAAATSPSPPAASSSSAEHAGPSGSLSAATSSIGVLVSGRTSFSAYSDESDGSYATEDDDDDVARRHPASLPVSPAHSDQFDADLVPEEEVDNVDAEPPALLPPQGTNYSRPTLRTRPSVSSISSASSAESAFPTTPGAKHFKGHPLPGLESCYDADADADADEGRGVGAPGQVSAPCVAPVEAKARPALGSLYSAQHALAQLHELELRPSHGAQLLLHQV